MSSPERGPKKQENKNEKLKLALRATQEQFRLAVEAFLAKPRSAKIDTKLVETLKSATLEELQALSEGKREYLMGQLLLLHKQINGSPYKPTKKGDAAELNLMSMATSGFAYALGLSEKLQAMATQESAAHEKQEERKRFFDDCALIKRNVPGWMPPMHPNLVHDAPPDQQAAFTDSLAAAVIEKNKQAGFVDVVLMMDTIKVIRQLHLEDRYPKVFDDYTLVKKAEADAAARHQADRERRREASGEEYDKYLDLLYADMIASTDFGKRYEQTNPHDQRSDDALMQDISNFVRERVSRYPRIAEMLGKQAQGSDEERAFTFFLGQIYIRLRQDFPRKAPVKKSWLPWRQKPEPTAVSPDTARYGEQLVDKAVDALYAEYRSHPNYTSTGTPGRPIQEMTNSLIGNQQALNHLRQILRLDEHTTEHQVARAIQDYLYQQLKRRGLRI